MRIHHASLLALPALLSALVVAVPSPASYFQQPLTPPVSVLQQQPRWKSVSDRLIESLFGIERVKDERRSRQLAYSDRQQPPSSHTLARYGGDVVLRFNISTAEEARSLAEAADTLLLDVWEFAHDWVDIRLSKDIVPSLLGLLPTSLQQSHTPLLHERDLTRLIHDSLQTSSPPPSQRPFSPSTQTQTQNNAQANFFFNDYQPLSVINPWLRFLASFFRTHVRQITIGISYQGRDIPGLRIGVHPTLNTDDPSEPQPKRKTVLITGGMHAREWIGTSTVNYIAWSLITGYGKTPGMTQLLEDFDFVLIPTLNPDGYVYTWETDRLWRKNRQQTNVRFCQGIDLDRGFGFEWDGVSTAGNPCSESFAGESPFEAVEAKRLADWARNETEENNVEFVGFLDLHSYSQEILYPYSYSCSDTPPGQENLEELARGLEKAIRLSSSLTYEVMPACQGNVASSKDGKGPLLLPKIEQSGGSALDWFYHELHVRYAYQIKLRDRGTYGFLLPKENIVPTGKEILNAVLYLGQFLREVYVSDENWGGDVEMVGLGVDGDDVEGEGEWDGRIKSGKGGKEVEIEEEEEEDGWVVVEDVVEEDEDPQWELRRRRRR